MSTNQYVSNNSKLLSNVNSHVVTTTDTATSNILFGDFQAIEFSGIPFAPQGCYIDNTASAAALVITLQPGNFVITVPAGVSAQTSFPSFSGLRYQIMGGGIFTIFWVDYVLNTYGLTISSGGGGATFKPLKNFNGFINAVGGGSLTLNLGGVNNYNLNALQIFASPNSEIPGSHQNIVQITAYIGNNRSGQVIFSKYMEFPTSTTTQQTGNEFLIADLVFEEGLGFYLGTNNIYLELWDPYGNYLTQMSQGILTLNALVSLS